VSPASRGQGRWAIIPARGPLLPCGPRQSSHSLRGSSVPNPNTAATARESRLIQPNADNQYTVSRADLPLHCPMDGMSLWNSHPRVYLAIEATGRAKCPYCGADYLLKD
jgi:uncharacterized Zn-finger protein